MAVKLRKQTLSIIAVVLTFVVGASLLLNDKSVFADEIEDVQKEINAQNQELEKIKNDLESSKQYLKDLENNKGTLYWQLNGVKTEVNAIRAKIEENEKSIESLNGEISSTSDLVNSRLDQKNTRVQSLYYQYKFPVFEFLMNVSDFNRLMRIWEYKESAIEVDHETLVSLNSQLENLQTNLEQIVFLKDELVAVNTDLDSEIEKLNAQIAGANSRISSEQNKQQSLGQQMSTIESNIGALTEKQKALIQAKLAAEAAAQRLLESSNVYNMPASPYSGAFAVASYGVPHRVGMSQYGAYGRALDGQNYEQILGAYFNADLVGGYASMDTIHVQGTDEQGRYVDEVMSFEGKYMKGIAEVPSSWPAEVQKAQAILARSYAIAFTNNGTKSIQPNQSNQVYNMDKVENSSASIWHQAVLDTSGMVLSSGGSPISAYYSASAGGYTKLGIESGYYAQNLPWMKSIKDYGPNGPYEGSAYAKSPFYHRFWGAKNDDWNTKHCTQFASYPSDCNPWLTNEETQDLFNIMLLMEVSGEEYNVHLSPLYYGYDDTWSHQQVIDKLIELGVTPIGTISEVLTYENNSGDTTTIIVKSANYPVREFAAQGFKNVYYLRSPGTLHIKTSRFDFIAS